MVIVRTAELEAGFTRRVISVTSPLESKICPDERYSLVPSIGFLCHPQKAGGPASKRAFMRSRHRMASSMDSGKVGQAMILPLNLRYRDFTIWTLETICNRFGLFKDFPTPGTLVTLILILVIGVRWFAYSWEVFSESHKFIQ